MSDIISIDYKGEDKVVRLDRFLAEEIPSLTRSRIQKLLEEGRVLTDGRCEKASYKLRTGESVTVEIPDPEPTKIAPVDMPLDIL